MKKVKNAFLLDTIIKPKVIDSVKIKEIVIS